MTWTQLLADNRVKAEPTAKSEMDDLRSIVVRSFADLKPSVLSTDLRFVVAYDAARTLSLMIVRAEGYRPRTVGGHFNTFQALQAADPAFVPLAVYFDSCRLKRNQSEYDFAGGVTDTETVHLIQTAERFAIDAEVWIKSKYPQLAV